jgi:hypothetical protein
MWAVLICIFNFFMVLTMSDEGFFKINRLFLAVNLFLDGESGAFSRGINSKYAIWNLFRPVLNGT